MKTFVLSLTSLILVSLTSSAQNPFYGFSFYSGTSLKQTPSTAALLVNRNVPLDEFRFQLDEVKTIITVGVRKNFQFSSPFFGSLGLEYSQKREAFSMIFTYQTDQRSASQYDLRTRKYTLALPIGVGVCFGKLDINSGLRAQYTLGSKLKGDMMMGIEMDQPRVEFGWHAGIGFTNDRTRIGISYQAMLLRDGHDMMHNGNPLELRSIPGNVMFTAGFSF